jgi:IS30 family transposase
MLNSIEFPLTVGRLPSIRGLPMDTPYKLVLGAFDRLASDRLEEADLSANVPADFLGAMRSTVERLVKGGWLRQVDGLYERNSGAWKPPARSILPC